jgi:hypothetical protein
LVRYTITCASCGEGWNLKKAFSFYEQQAMEGCPCPRCGAYTLCCVEPRERKPFELASPVRDWQAGPPDRKSA